MDQHKLRSLVFEKTGVRVDTDDPIFALVALNEVVLEEAVERHVALLDEATRELAAQAKSMQGSGGCRYIDVAELPPPRSKKKTAAAAVSEFETAAATLPTSAPAVVPAPAITPQAARAAELRIVAVAAGAAVFSAALVLAGMALFFKPQPMPAPVVQARELTAEQTAAIKNGEKLAKIVQKLDPKTRSAIQAEMQKP